MITFNPQSKTFHLAGPGYSHILRVRETGQLETLHWGAPLHPEGPLESLIDDFPLGYGSMVAVDTEHPATSLELLCLEASPWGRGDFREPSLVVEDKNGDPTGDFRYHSHRISPGTIHRDGLPGLLGGGIDGIESLEIDLLDGPRNLVLTLGYTVFPHLDAELRWTRVLNTGTGPARVRSAASLQADFPPGEFCLSTLDGAWIRENGLTRAPLVAGKREISSRRGLSSAAHVPFLLLDRPDTTETSGEAWACTLVYSGNHRCLAEQNPHGLTRIQLGIDPLHFSWTLEAGQHLDLPEAVAVYSATGRDGTSTRLQSLVQQHLVRGPWKQKTRPLLANTWESFYFSFNAAKVLKAAKLAKDRGLELFVIDDGWFAGRNNDSTSLGDWIPDTKKFPRGLKPVADKIKAMGLLFGLWVEPEMVSPTSQLALEHPDWILKGPSHEPIPGRNQQVLDLCQKPVRDHLVAVLTELFSSTGLDYVKWDMNRNLNDLWSPSLGPERQGEMSHRWVLGLYDVLDRITRAFPQVLFENCASGGNRNDWGMLAYFQQAWISDNTDAAERPLIQHGASHYLPPSVWGAHVSASPNHQTLRRTSIEDRFNAAAFGLLGFELDLASLTPAERTLVDRQVAWYKNLRETLQFGTFHRLMSPGRDRSAACMTLSRDGTQAVVGYFGGLARPNALPQRLKLRGLDPRAVYRVEARPQATDLRPYGALIHQALPISLKINGVLYSLVADRYLLPLDSPSYMAPGDLLMGPGLKLSRPFHGTGSAPGILVAGDFSSQIFVLTKETS